MTARQLALIVLYEVEKNQAFVSLELKNKLGTSDLSPRDRAFATELVYGVVKNRTRLDYIISKFSRERLKKLSVWILNILRLGVYQILLLDKIPQSAAVNESVKLAKRYGHSASSGFVNGVLRSVAREGDAEYPKGREFYEVYHSHPKWLVDMMFDQYGEEGGRIIESNNNVAPVTVRVNPLKTDARGLAKTLGEKGIEVTRTEEENVLALSGYGDISGLEEYKEGLFTPQGLSSYLAAKAVEPNANEVILDLCSAPGGKTTALAELCGDKAKIYAFDLYDHKKALIENNCKRLGIKGVSVGVADAAVVMEDFVGKADKVLADVPCSGLGIIRKKPDIKWNKATEDFEEIIKIQKQILHNASKYVKEGGLLVYSTCTVNKDENDGVVDSFLSEHGFEKIYSQTYLPNGNFDGFYIAKLRRKNG